MSPLFFGLIPPAAYLTIGLILVGLFQFAVKLPMGKFLIAWLTWPRLFFPRREALRNNKDAEPETVREPD